MIALLGTFIAFGFERPAAIYPTFNDNQLIWFHLILICCVLCWRAHVFSLYKAAEEARLPKRLRSDLGGTLREFTSRESHCFAQSKNQDGSSALFTSQERQWLVLQVLQGLRAGTNDLAALQGRASVEEGQSISNKIQSIVLLSILFNQM